jgi:hypothetical protein
MTENCTCKKISRKMSAGCERGVRIQRKAPA